MVPAPMMAQRNVSAKALHLSLISVTETARKDTQTAKCARGQTARHSPTRIVALGARCRLARPLRARLPGTCPPNPRFQRSQGALMSYPYPQDRHRDCKEKGEQPYKDDNEAMSQTDAELRANA